MDNPFQDLQVLPSNGQREAIVSWKMANGYTLGTFTVQRSEDGDNNWTDIGVVQDNDHFIDPNFVLTDRSSELYYRVRYQDKLDQQFVSQSVATFGAVDRETFGIASGILWNEGRVLRREGTNIKIFRQRRDGEPCPACVDADTGQRIGTTLCPVCFGTTIKGGYYPPVNSFMIELKTSSQVVLDAADGAGSEDPVEVTVRLPAFPPLLKNDLIVIPKSDQRFLVQKLDNFSFRNQVTLICEGPLVQLRRSDIRYKVPV